ncbi:hypothetical protein V1523DRAFT_49169 [Lipomyces doorenjongii]
MPPLIGYLSDELLPKKEKLYDIGPTMYFTLARLLLLGERQFIVKLHHSVGDLKDVVDTFSLIFKYQYHEYSVEVERAKNTRQHRHSRQLFAACNRDDYSNSTPGYSFISERMNELPVDFLWKALLRDLRMSSHYITGDNVVHATTRPYLELSIKLLEILFLLMHLTYGSPARMTEIDSWKHVNSVHGMRNVYCHQRGLVFLGLYNKQLQSQARNAL